MDMGLTVQDMRDVTTKTLGILVDWKIWIHFATPSDESALQIPYGRHAILVEHASSRLKHALRRFKRVISLPTDEDNVSCCGDRPWTC